MFLFFRNYAFQLMYSVVLIILTIIYIQGCNIVYTNYFVGEKIFQLHMRIFFNYDVMSFMFMIYFLVIILNIAFLIVFAILTYFEFVLKGRNGFLKLFFILFEISYLLFFFSTWRNVKWRQKKGSLVFFTVSVLIQS